jgi:hypothetical protein
LPKEPIAVYDAVDSIRIKDKDWTLILQRREVNMFNFAFGTDVWWSRIIFGDTVVNAIFPCRWKLCEQVLGVA